MMFDTRKLLAVAVVLACGLLVAFSSTAKSDIIPNVLNAHMDEASWNGTANEVGDSSGNGNHGTACGDATTVASGILGRAGTFDGTSDGVNFGDLATLQSFSVEAWAKDLASTTYADNHFAIKVNEWYLTQNNKSVRFEVTVTGGSAHAYDQVTQVPSDGKWHQVVGTFDGTTGTAAVYLDGDLLDTGSQTGTITDTASSVEVGLWSGYTPGLNGKLDEFGIYNYALTEAQVKERYAAVIPEPSTIALAAVGLMCLVLGYARKQRTG